MSQESIRRPVESKDLFVKASELQFTASGADFIMALLTKRFGPMTAKVRERLSKMRFFELCDFQARFYRAESFHELGLDDCQDAPIDEGSRQYFDQLLQTPPYVRVRSMVKTYSDLAEERGILKGERGALLRLLERRFGPLSDAVKARVEALTLARVRQVTDAILSVQSLRELGLEN